MFLTEKIKLMETTYQLLTGNSARTGGKSIKGQANQAFYKELIDINTGVDSAGLGGLCHYQLSLMVHKE